MENASKALIIAGAILLSILLISLGIMIFNQAQSTINNNGLEKAEIEQFNNKFLKYEGEIPGNTVKGLVNEVIASNANDLAPSVITVTLGGTTIVKKDASGTINKTNTIKTTKKYNVELGYNNGVVNTITLTEK